MLSYATLCRDFLTLYACTVSVYKLFVVKGFPLLKTERCLSSSRRGRKGMKIERIESKVCLHIIAPMKCYPSDHVAVVCQCLVYSRSKLSRKHFAVNMPFYFPDMCFFQRGNDRPKQGITISSTHNYEMLLWCGTKNTLKSSNRTQRDIYQ